MQHKTENNQYPQPQKMPRFERAYIFAMLVAAFIAEGALTSYKNFQGTAQNIYTDEQKSVEVFKESAEYRTRAEQLRKDIAKLEQSTEDKQERNRKALASYGDRVSLYSEEIRKDTEESSRLKSDFDTWVTTQLTPIRAQFADKRRRASEKSLVGFVSGVSFSWFVPLLVIALGYLSTRQADQWRWVLLGLSFIPQLLSSQMAYDGAILKFGQEDLALITGIMFFFCLPPLYHFGIIALRSNKAICVEEGSVVPSAEKRSQPQNHGGKISHTSTTIEFELTDQGYKKAVQFVAKEMNGGNGKGLFTTVLRHFEPAGLTKATVWRDIQRARDGKLIAPRLKNRLKPSETHSETETETE